MKHKTVPAQPEAIDITEHFLTHGAPIEPIRASYDNPFEGAGEQAMPNAPFTPIQEVPEPAISMATIGHYASILLTGMGWFFIGTLIGNAIAYLLP